MRQKAAKAPRCQKVMPCWICCLTEAEEDQLKEQSNYIDGSVNGKYEGWHESGHRKFEANYSNGQLDGNVYRWTDNGKTISEQSFKEGLLIQEL